MSEENPQKAAADGFGYQPVELSTTADISRGHLNLHSLIREFVVALVALAVAYFLLVQLWDVVAVRIPDRYEAKFGEYFSPSHGDKVRSDGKNSQNFSRKEDESATSRVHGIFARLLALKPRRQLNFKLNIVENKEPNAFAMPGGGVVVTRGLLNLVKGDTGLALVLGHELGHHAYRHVLRRTGRMVLVTLVKSVVFAGGSSDFELGENMTELSFSRSDEIEADQYGLRLVHRAFGTTAGVTEFFEEIMKKQSVDGSDDRSFGKQLFQTHPFPEDRIRRLQKLAALLEGK